MSEQHTGMKKVIISGMIGNGLEWYVYALYGQMATFIGEMFFPSEDPTTSMMLTFASFAVGFIARPFGGLIFGWIGDKIGRQRSLSLSIIVMAVTTGLIGLMPTYEHIGILAPIALMLLRLVQGISIGGEFSGAIVYMVEHSDTKRRGIVGSMAMVSLVLGFLVGSLVAYFFSTMLSQEDFHSWGWRIPFLVGLAIGLVGLYIRNSCHESPLYTKAKAEGHLAEKPVQEVFTKHLKDVGLAIGIYLLVTIPFYFSSIYFITLNTKHLGVPMETALEYNTIAMLLMFIGVPISAWLSDKYGRKKVLMSIGVVYLLITYPMFSQFSPDNLDATIPMQLFFAFVVGLYLGPVPAVLAEIFPTSVRNTGMAISYNLSAAIFGGTVPMVATYLFGQFPVHALEYLALYVTAGGIVAMICLWLYHDRYREPLL